MKKKILLAFSYFSALILGFLGFRHVSLASEAKEETLPRPIAKSSSQSPRKQAGAENISSFLPQPDDYYRELAETLPLPADFPSELAALALEMGEFLTNDEGQLDSSNSAQFETLNRFHAQLRNWMLNDKEGFLQYFKQEELRGSDIERMALLTPPGAISDFLAEDGLINNLAFFQLEKSKGFTKILVDAFTQEVKSGQSLKLFNDIESQLGQVSTQLATKMIGASARYLPFEDRYELIDRGFSNESFKSVGPSYLSDFIFNPEHPPEQLRLWLNELKELGMLGEYSELNFMNQLCQPETQFSLEERRDIAQQIYPTESSWVIGRSLGDKVRGFLDSERDYRYEFQTGLVTGPEILAALRAQEPDIFVNHSDEIILKLYQSLSKVGKQRAAAVLNELSDPSRSPLLRETNNS